MASSPRAAATSIHSKQARSVRNPRTRIHVVTDSASAFPNPKIALRPDVEEVFIDYIIELIAPVEKNLPKPMDNQNRRTDAARAIEPLAMLWCIPGFRENSWSHAFKLLKK